VIEQQVFNNRYRLDSKLGEGGMAIVYCGTDTLLRRRVAVKVLREQYAVDEEFVRRFYQEAESAAKLSHPNIVNTYDVGREGSLYYIVMELIDGPSLAEIIAADGKLPEPVAIDYAAQICNGLAYAHRQGLLHRDIKPANILVTKDDVVKLSDFGIARAVSAQTMALTKPGLVMGSVYYISPEQAQGHDLRESSDLYSVGIVLYQMLTGNLPFTGESPVTVALKHISDPVPTIDTRALGTSPALAAIVNRLLQKQPENRFQSAADVASALREARERPAVAAYSIQNDAPTIAFYAQQLPPRRTPLPDHSYSSISEDEERTARSTTRVVTTLVAMLVVATVIGYFLFGRQLPHFSTNITVGNYREMTDVEASQAIANAGLVVRITKRPSDTVEANHVIEQNPSPGTPVDANAVVELFVSNGLPMIGLRDVTNFTLNDAQRDLAGDKFNVRVVRHHAPQPKDTVLDQKPKAGSSVRQGSYVTLVVSDGPALALLPSLLGMTVLQAQAVAQKDGFALDASQSVPSAQYPAGVIAAQDVNPGTLVDRTLNMIVHVTVSTGPPPVSTNNGNGVVPNVQGRAYADAVAALRSAGFDPAIVYNTQSAGNGTIIAQEPQANSNLPQGASVTITLSVSGEVPDTQGLTIDQARATLEANGYVFGDVRYTSIEGAGGKVVRTQPEAGTTLQPGSRVTLVVNGTQQ
jgi:serine/threonine-protein kinase